MSPSPEDGIGQAPHVPPAPANWATMNASGELDRALAESGQPMGASAATWTWFLIWIAAVLALFIFLALIAIPPGA